MRENRIEIDILVAKYHMRYLSSEVEQEGIEYARGNDFNSVEFYTLKMKNRVSSRMTNM